MPKCGRKTSLQWYDPLFNVTKKQSACFLSYFNPNRWQSSMVEDIKGEEMRCILAQTRLHQRLSFPGCPNLWFPYPLAALTMRGKDFSFTFSVVIDLVSMTHSSFWLLDLSMTEHPTLKRHPCEPSPWTILGWVNLCFLLSRQDFSV